MPVRFDLIPARRRLIDRRSLAAELAEMDRDKAAKRLKKALADGRAEIAQRLLDKPYAGTEAAAAYAYLTDQILRLVHDYVIEQIHPIPNPVAMILSNVIYLKFAIYDLQFATPLISTPFYPLIANRKL